MRCTIRSPSAQLGRSGTGWTYRRTLSRLGSTAVAHPNIALVKYWGKADESENLPSVGDHVEAGAALATVHAADEVHADRAALRLLDAVQLTEARPAATRPVVHDRLVPGRSAVN